MCLSHTITVEGFWKNVVYTAKMITKVKSKTHKKYTWKCLFFFHIYSHCSQKPMTTSAHKNIQLHYLEDFAVINDKIFCRKTTIIFKNLI